MINAYVEEQQKHLLQTAINKRKKKVIQVNVRYILRKNAKREIILSNAIKIYLQGTLLYNM